MPIKVEIGNIIEAEVDAIINAANASLLGGGGVDGVIHRAAGPELSHHCANLGGCQPGEAVLTPGFLLSPKQIIHTVGPIWRGGNSGEEDLLSSCYINIMSIAAENGMRSIAIPSISTGAYAFPKERAAQIAVSSLLSCKKIDEIDVTLCAFPPKEAKPIKAALKQFEVEND